MDVRVYHLPGLDLLDIWTLFYPGSVGLAIWIWCGSKRDLGNLRATSKKSGGSVVITCSECDAPYRGMLRTARFDSERRISIPKYCTSVPEIIHCNDRCFEHSKEWLRSSYDLLIERARARRPRPTERTASGSSGALLLREHHVFEGWSSEGGWHYFFADTEEPYTTVVWFTLGMQHRRRCLCSLCNKLREERLLL